MSLKYQAVMWNRQKKIYDSVLIAGVVLYLGLFSGLGAIFHVVEHFSYHTGQIIYITKMRTEEDLQFWNV